MKTHFFQSPFTEEEFKEFLQSFIPQLIFSSSRNETRTGFDFIRQIGEVRNPNLDLVVFVATPLASINARVDITKNTYAFLKTHARSNALVAYISQETQEWRFSLITTKVTRTSEGIKETVSNPRRFSYVLGPGAKVLTPIKMLQGTVDSIKDLESKFSLAVVSKEFYTRIAAQYSKLVGGTRGEGRRAETYERMLGLGSVDDTVYANFAIRLIGRLVFCWFLKQKKGSQHVPLIPHELLSVAAVSKNADYYHSLCAPLFFEVLNKPLNSRPSFFAHSELFDKVPFLNGGLFQDHVEDNHKFSRTTGLSERRGVVTVPDTWFAEMFGIFEEYNFTIDENTSIDTELSIDPEMLGRIFENLLAEVNPETGASARKATGSFYTPREIVDFMVEESLVAHLKTRTGIPEEKLRVLSSYDLEDDDRYPFTNDEKKILVDAIHNTAVLDPACGSGAFPIGVLQRMVHMLEVLDPDCSIYLNKFPAEARRQLQKHNLTYVRKLGVIRECIHGIDIQPVATDISRLRCFLTLVVDQQVDDSAPNRGIEPLPNLDFKFVCANTLIKPPVHEGPLFGDEFATALGELIDEYFAPVDQMHKLETARKLQQLISEKTKKELESILQSFSGIKDKNHKRLLAKKNEVETGERMRINELWGSYENIFQNKPVGFFDTRYFFPAVYRKGGFSIVLGNPPYISALEASKIIPADIRDTFKRDFISASGTYDIYLLFFEKGINLLSPGGILSYITPTKYISANYAKEFRKQIGTPRLIGIADFSHSRVFESAGVSTFVSFYSDAAISDPILSRVYEGYEDLSQAKSFLNSRASLSSLPENLWGHLVTGHYDLIEKIYKNAHVAESVISVNGSSTAAEGDEFSAYINEDGIGYKIINTGTISPYVSRWGLKEYRNKGKLILKPYIDIEKVNDRRRQMYSQSKVIIPKLGSELVGVLDSRGEFASTNTTFLYNFNAIYTPALSAALINSKLMNFVYMTIFSGLNMLGSFQFQAPQIRLLPFPKLDTDAQKILVEPIENIVAAVMKKREVDKDGDIQDLLSEINGLLYKLYGLTKKEINMVETSFKK